MPLQALTAVVGPSVRLRDEAAAGLIATWNGPRKRAVEPADLAHILADVDTPSLFGEPTLWLLRGDDPWLRRHQEALAGLAGRPAAGGGAIVLLVAGLDARWSLAKALEASAALLRADPPWSGLRPADAAAAARAWVAERLAVHQPGVRRPLVAAERIVAHAGEDADALLTAIDMIRALAGDEPIEPEPIDELLSGSPERPFWEFSGAVLQGEVRKALSILHAGRGMDPEQALATLLGEIRRCLVCLECPDDAEAHRRLGRRGGSLFHARRTAQALGTASLQRLLTGCLLASRELRQGGTDRQLAIETLVLHARAVVGAGKR